MSWWIVTKRSDPTPEGAFRSWGAFTARDDLETAKRMASLCVAEGRREDVVLAEVDVVPTGRVVELEVEDAADG